MVLPKCRHYPAALSRKRVRKSPFKTIAKTLKAERNFKAGKSIGFTKRSSLKSMGRIPRASGCYELGRKYIGIS